MSALSDLMGVLLPGGIAAGAALVVQAVRSWRDGRNSKEETAIQRWQRLSTEADNRTNVAELDEAYAVEVGRYWQRRAGDLEHLCRSNGIEVPPLADLPERRKVRVTSGTARRRKALRRAPDDVDEDVDV